VTILAVTGLKREARILAGPGVLAIPCGGREAETLEAALAADAAAAEAIISVGIGGALAAGLRPGDWVVATGVAGGAEGATDPAWTAVLAARLPAAATGIVLGSDRMLTTAAEKRAAHHRFGALAVDMESSAAARLAQRYGLPFAVARVISDAAESDLPDAVKVGMTPQGGMALGAVLWALAKDPAQLPGLMRTGRDAGRAFRALADGRRLLGPRIGLPNLVQLPLDMG
jgi:adenosylhomocysteine nucleosidase